MAAVTCVRPSILRSGSLLPPRGLPARTNIQYHLENTRLVYRQTRMYSQRRSGGRGGGIFGSFFENLRKDLESNKELEASLKGIQEETSRIGVSQITERFKEGTIKAKEYVVHYTSVSVTAVRSGWTKSWEYMTSAYRKVRKTAFGKTTGDIASRVSTSAEDTVKKVSSTASTHLGGTQAFQKVAEGAKVVKEELLDDVIQRSKPYISPEELKKRTDPSRASSFSSATQSHQQAAIEPNEEEKGVVVTKQSKLSSWWNKLRENNPISSVFYSVKMKYDESDNLAVRATRVVTDKVGDGVGNVFTQSDMAKALSEIHKVDPSFNKEAFIRECEVDIIPTVLEAFLQGNKDVLKDWCHEAAFNVLSAQIEHNMREGHKIECKVLDVRDVDIVMAKVLEQGPILILTFAAQQWIRLRNSKGEIIEEGEDNLENVHYVWALCRDQEIYDPRTAWRVLEFAIQASTKLLV